jgi:adenylate kinase
LFQREDDKEETMRARLEAYEAQTAPLIDFYDSKKLLRTIDGIGSIQEINGLMIKVLEG